MAVTNKLNPKGKGKEVLLREYGLGQEFYGRFLVYGIGDSNTDAVYVEVDKNTTIEDIYKEIFRQGRAVGFQEGSRDRLYKIRKALKL